MDAITLLKDDHKNVERLFQRFEKAGDRAYAEKREIVDRIIEELSVHAVVEEQLFYPVTRSKVPSTEDIALESLEEHHIVKWVLSELDGMSPEHERFDAKVTVLMENVRHHVEEEEGDYFPKARKGLGRKELSELGDAMAKAKRVAPTHPHPRAPDTPPGNLVAGAASSMVDRVGDKVSEVVGTMLGRKKPPPADRATSSAKKAASSTKKAASSTKKAASSTKEAASTTRKRAASTARKAASTTKKAASSTKKAAGSTKRAAAATTKKAVSAGRTAARRR